MQLANLAKDHGFIDKETWEKIQEFNDIRKKGIHGLIRGKLTYAELEEPAKSTFEIAYAIQNKWSQITFGKQETYEEYKAKNRQ